MDSFTVCSCRGTRFFGTFRPFGGCARGSCNTGTGRERHFRIYADPDLWRTLSVFNRGRCSAFDSGDAQNLAQHTNRQKTSS